MVLPILLKKHLTDSAGRYDFKVTVMHIIKTLVNNHLTL